MMALMTDVRVPPSLTFGFREREQRMHFDIFLCSGISTRCDKTKTNRQQRGGAANRKNVEMLAYHESDDEIEPSHSGRKRDTC